ncbi:MarR family winged helix-turn-helix transcriptional regulator [Nocardioides luteus]|uniref:MarR family winged helix-turn-helix transcriptional regulator n=1 Tax=Nocardioides luteus TaxID=1844 RepID=UPI001A1A0691|nr:MarR family transcriptional regulator [Nocardioides luteus]MBG6095719.1 DNA-binding MarR family transcriptional regulator [Nocardioides luteus]
MEGNWLSPAERAAWVRLIAVLELLPGALDSQLRRDAGLTHFDYGVLAMLSEAPGRTLRMTELAGYTNATLPRLSNVVKRLADRGLIERLACPGDRRATNVRLTEAGHEKMVASAPGHVDAVREYVFDSLSPEQVDQLSEIAGTMLERLDPTGVKRPPLEETAPE